MVDTLSVQPLNISRTDVIQYSTNFNWHLSNSIENHHQHVVSSSSAPTSDLKCFNVIHTSNICNALSLFPRTITCQNCRSDAIAFPLTPYISSAKRQSCAPNSVGVLVELETTRMRSMTVSLLGVSGEVTTL